MWVNFIGRQKRGGRFFGQWLNEFWWGRRCLDLKADNPHVTAQHNNKGGTTGMINAADCFKPQRHAYFLTQITMAARYMAYLCFSCLKTFLRVIYCNFFFFSFFNYDSKIKLMTVPYCQEYQTERNSQSRMRDHQEFWWDQFNSKLT